jgi:TPR repeat protein
MFGFKVRVWLATRGAVAASIIEVGVVLASSSGIGFGQGIAETDAQVRQANELAAKGGADNMSSAARLYEQAALAGNADAMNRIANCYVRGKGVAVDLEKAFRWYQKGSAAGNLKALNNLAYCYLNGMGTTKDARKAFECFERGAKAGVPDSFGNLGWCYEAGEGVARDPGKAATLYEKAAKAGVSDYLTRLGKLYEAGDGVEQDFPKALECYSKRAAEGDLDAMKRLGSLYETGKGVPRDSEKAVVWYVKGAGETPVLCKNLSASYVLAGSKVVGRHDPAMLAALSKFGEADARKLASMQLRLDRDHEEFIRKAGEVMNPDEVVGDMSRKILFGVLNGNPASQAMLEGFGTTAPDRIKSVIKASVDGLEGDKRIRAQLYRLMSSRPETPPIEAMNLPILFRAENKQDIEVAIVNKTGRTLRDCVVITEAKVDVARINAVSQEHEVAALPGYGLAILFAGDKESDKAAARNMIESSRALEKARWDYERADKGVVIFVPEWPADARLETTLSPIRAAIYSESAGVWIWSADGHFQAELSYERIANAVTRAFPQQPAPKTRPRR